MDILLAVFKAHSVHCERMKNYIIIVFYLILLFLSLPCLAEESPQIKTAEKQKLPSLQKSLLIPGWGQLAEKKYAKGFLFLSAEIFCVYEIFRYNHKGNYYYNKYKTAENVDDTVRFRQLTENHDTTRNQYILLAAGVWAVNLMDIFLINKKKDNKDNDLKITIEKREKQSLALTISYSF